MASQFEKTLAEFREDDFTNETIWRSIILFGKNTASYKFSLAKGILDLAKQGKSGPYSPMTGDNRKVCSTSSLFISFGLLTEYKKGMVLIYNIPQ